MPTNDRLFIFTKTSVHIPLNWNLFAGCKDNLAEPTSCSAAETGQRMDRLAFVCWPITLSWRSFRGPQDKVLLQPEGALPGAQTPSAPGEARDLQSQLDGTGIQGIILPS